MKERSGNPDRRILLGNPDEPRAGDYSYGLYDKAHPVFGEPDTVAYMRKQLRGLRGKEVSVVVKGVRIDDEGNAKRFTARRTVKLNSYRDIFGPGSAYASAVHAVRERHSDDTLVTHAITVEPTDYAEETDYE